MTRNTIFVSTTGLNALEILQEIKCVLDFYQRIDVPVDAMYVEPSAIKLLENYTKSFKEFDENFDVHTLFGVPLKALKIED